MRGSVLDGVGGAVVHRPRKVPSPVETRQTTDGSPSGTGLPPDSLLDPPRRVRPPFGESPSAPRVPTIGPVHPTTPRRATHLRPVRVAALALLTLGTIALTGCSTGAATPSPSTTAA